MMDLPDGWTAATLHTVADWSSGGTPSRKRSEFFGGDIPWIKTGELTEKYVRETEETLTELGVKSSSAKVFPRGSVGIAMYGATIGKVSIWGIDASTNQACAVARPINGVVSSEFLYHFLRYERAALVREGKGGAQPNISQGLLKAWPIPLPPLKEQHRIVAKIEALFDEIDRGAENLRDAKRGIGLYRQSLLKSAFEGRLTADWRAKNPEKLESPEALLARIREEREQRYQAALDEWERATAEWHDNGELGKKPTKPKRPSDFAVEACLSAEDFGELSNQWLWLHLSNLGQVSGGLTKSQKRDLLPLKAKYLRVANVYSNRLNLNQIKEIGVSEEELRKTRLVDGDLLFVEGNGSIEQIGRVAVWNDSVPDMTHQNHLIRFRTNGLLSPRFALYFMISPLGRRRITAQASSTSGLHTLSISKVAGLPVPLCSPAEQAEIVRILDDRLAAIDTLEAEIDANFTRAETLRQSILKQAFSGQLVPQNPEDEPAEVLLERIKADKATQTPKGATRKRQAVTA
ncbi:MAG: restriction endonuclease subunit S [Gammaproteobacteria bacterium]|nr:restriction endonuclease subunit S [Gammaproteobacteria bacterium]